MPVFDDGFFIVFPFKKDSTIFKSKILNFQHRTTKEKKLKPILKFILNLVNIKFLLEKIFLLTGFLYNLT